MMKLPASIRVGAHSYTVAPTDAKKLVEGDEERNGDTDPDELVIRLRKRMRRSKAQEILLHEVLHACIYPLTIRDEEKLVTALAPVLLQVLKENPELLKYLLTE